jgi:hypothetical protein
MKLSRLGGPSNDFSSWCTELRLKAGGIEYQFNFPRLVCPLTITTAMFNNDGWRLVCTYRTSAVALRSYQSQAFAPG